MKLAIFKKEYSRRRNKEISFDELSEQELQSLCVSDEYFADEYIFDILGGSVTVRNERLAKSSAISDRTQA